jgi:Polyketide cyclase / dehydrase and lipid transport
VLSVVASGSAGLKHASETMATMPSDRIEVSRHIAASPHAVFDLLCTPAGHVAIDSSGMLQSAEGEGVTAAGDTFLVHMDREALGDLPMGRYDVTVIITRFEPDALIEWTISGTIQPPIRHLYGYRLEPDGEGTLVTSYYDWSEILDRYRDRITFPVVPASALRATLGILARTLQG